jgi:hydrogenase expression/formation protein HypC
MCLAVPGRIAEILDEDPLFRRGRVDFGGVTKEINLAYVPEAQVDDYVLVHVGFGLSTIDRDEARKTLALLRAMGELEGDFVNIRAEGAPQRDS